MNKNHLVMQAKGRTLEDAFFLQQDKTLMEQYHQFETTKKTKESLAKVSGITNPEVLEKLVELDIRPDLVATLALVPLVEVAWADGSIKADEKEAILKADAQIFTKDSPDLAVLKQWLEHKPGPELLIAWKEYIKGLCEQLTSKQKSDLKTEVIGHARQVAEAAGGFLGIGNKISKAEQEMLDRLEAAFD